MYSVEIVELSTYRTTGKYPFSKHKPKLNTAEETVVIKIIDYNTKLQYSQKLCCPENVIFL